MGPVTLLRWAIRLAKILFLGVLCLSCANVRSTLAQVAQRVCRYQCMYECMYCINGFITAYTPLLHVVSVLFLAAV